MRDASAFDRAEFLGLAHRSRRDPYRLGLFARHLEPDEDPLAVLPVVGGTLVVTDRRLLELSTHLEVDGAWNVREFTGYTLSESIPLASILAAERRTTRSPRVVEDVLDVSVVDREVSFPVSRGPEKVVGDDDFARVLALLTRSIPRPGPTSGASPGRARTPG